MSTDTAFTPGPWAASHGGPRSNQWTVWADGGDMGDQRVAVMPYELIAQCGNAHLIAAAPNTYDALDRAVGRLETIRVRLCRLAASDGTLKAELVDYIRQCEAEGEAALAKARGDPNVSGLSHTGVDRG